MKKLILVCCLALFGQITVAQSEATFDLNSDAFSLMTTQGPAEFMDQFIDVPFERYGFPTAALYLKAVGPKACPKVCMSIGGFMAEEAEAEQLRQQLASAKPGSDDQDEKRLRSSEAMAKSDCVCLIPKVQN